MENKPALIGIVIILLVIVIGVFRFLNSVHNSDHAEVVQAAWDKREAPRAEKEEESELEETPAEQQHEE